MTLKSVIKGIWANKFRRYLILTLILIGIGMVVYEWDTLLPKGGLGAPSVAPAEREFNPIFYHEWLGEINLLGYSLPALAVILGLVDGFNPCAMWVLVFLISVVVGLNDKRKIWFIVGSFVLASGILYFLFMTVWFNIFLYVGFLRPVILLIGLFALGIGVWDLKSFFTTKGAMVCEVQDEKGHQKTMDRIRQIVHSPLTFATIFAIIGLAFVVNSIEFACSSGIPVVFTGVLSVSNLPTWQYYAYILLYDLFFMLDDLIVFGLAAFAINTAVGSKYVKYCKLIGGIVLLVLGMIMVFFPQFLV
ncbi:MAG TPA: hypothetical protein VJH97_02580 [Candidatus Nanoarchaeia archaeon]|nr:hypothetical protein [Candidatus Nanoarchaeia archaeon]